MTFDESSLPSRVVVTGAGSGIGAATARLLLTSGVEVIATDVVPSGLTELERQGATAVIADITSPSDRRRILDIAGGASGLVNAAGIIRPLALEDVTEQDWDTTMALNLKATFFLARDAGLAMRRGGAIVNIASAAARYGVNVEVLAYAASKAGLLAVTRGLAHAFGSRGIRVNAILPGFIETPMQEAVLNALGAIRGRDASELAAARVGLVPLEQRTGTPEECAGAVAFLLSEQSAYITGQALSVDGGLVMA
jgi:NAD(P)-dependent dehydrogenase (short-subunit alcohol dehydrogenase family)